MTGWRVSYLHLCLFIDDLPFQGRLDCEKLGTRGSPEAKNVQYCDSDHTIFLAIIIKKLYVAPSNRTVLFILYSSSRRKNIKHQIVQS